MSNKLRTYHRELALYVLGGVADAMSAGMIAETMGALAVNEGLPKSCFSGIDAKRVYGIMCELENSGQVVRIPGAARDARAGRETPGWRIADGQPKPRMPLPPDDESLAGKPTKPFDPYEGMSREQLINLLQVHDNISGATARFKQELREVVTEYERALDAQAAAARAQLAGAAS